MYKAGDIIIYNNEGVCLVKSIDKLNVAGIDKDRLYYNLSPFYSMGNIFVPIDTKLFIRPVINFEEAQRIISLIPSLIVSPVNYQNRRMLEEYYNHYIQSHDCLEWIRLLKMIHLKELQAAGEKKKLGAIEERFRKKAEELLFGEFAVALNLRKDEVKSFIEIGIHEMEMKKSLSAMSVIRLPGQAHG